MQGFFLLPKRYLTHYADVPKECWQSVFLNFVEALATGICFFLSLYFTIVLHISIVEAGFIVSFYAIGTVCGGFLSGKLSDYVSAKEISTFCLLAQAMGFYLLTKLQSEYTLCINMFLIGFFTYGFITSNNIWMLKQCQNHTEMRLKSINIRRAASNLGLGVSGVIIGFLAIQQYHSLFYFSSLVLIGCAIYSHYCMKDGAKVGLIENSTDRPLCYNKKIMLLMLNCVFLVNLVISQLNITYPIYIQQSFPQLGGSAVSILFVLDTLVIVLFQVPLINSLKKINKIALVGFGAFLMGSGMYILNFSFVFSIAILSCLIWTIGEIIFLGMSQFVCYEAGGVKKKGQAMGIYQATSSLGRIIGPILGASVYYSVGSSILWSLSMLIGVYCLFVCLYFRRYDFIKC